MSGRGKFLEHWGVRLQACGIFPPEQHVFPVVSWLCPLLQSVSAGFLLNAWLIWPELASCRSRTVPPTHHRRSPKAKDGLWMPTSRNWCISRQTRQRLMRSGWSCGHIDGFHQGHPRPRPVAGCFATTPSRLGRRCLRPAGGSVQHRCDSWKPLKTLVLWDLIGSPTLHQKQMGTTPERNRNVHQEGCDLVNVEGNTAQGITHNNSHTNQCFSHHLHFKSQLKMATP